jgi:hypothetical protein
MRRSPLGKFTPGASTTPPRCSRAATKKPVIAAKLAYYRSVLLVRQERIGAELHIREADKWRVRRLSSATAKLDIPDVGVIGRLGEWYEATRLDPFPRKAA